MHSLIFGNLPTYYFLCPRKLKSPISYISMMKNNLLNLLLVLLFVSTLSTASAEVVSKEVAKSTAESILALDSEWTATGDAEITLVSHEGAPAYYIIEYKQGGWAIVSAQTTSDPLIAYNHTGEYYAPAPMQMVLDKNARYIVDLSKDVAQVNHEGWQRPMQRKPAADIPSTPDVAPLITVDLNQTYPFNTQCPKIDGKNCLVGCVAVGMAQAMMVARYPEAPEGNYTYQCDGIGTLSINYDNEPPYDWDAMYASPETNNYDEIARFVYHCGVSVNMYYGLDGSGTQTPNVAKALVRNFKYDENYVYYIDKPEGDNADEEWLELLLDELILGRVIVYRGQGDESGHCWNLDGWKKSTQMVHVNWGWGGYGNGYFKINAMEDKYQGTSFPYMNGAVLGVGAPTTAPYGVKLSTNKFVVGTAAGVALADVIVSCEDPNAVFEYEIKGAKNVLGVHTASPYSVVDGKLVSNKTIEDTNAFKYMLMKVINTNTGESFEKEFTIQITQGDGAVDAVMSDAMRVYPSVADNYITVEAPVAGGEYAIYSVSGAQVAEGQIAGYKADVDVASLAAGTYILRYTHNEGVGVKTFIKK